MEATQAELIFSKPPKAKASQRLSVPVRGRTIFNEAEKRGSIIRKATRILYQGACKANGPKTALSKLFNSSNTIPDISTAADANLRAAWLLINEWLLVHANMHHADNLSLEEAERLFIGSEITPTSSLLSQAFTQRSRREAMMCMRQLSVDDSLRDLLPYVLDPHGPGSRASVLRDPSTATARARRRASGVYFTPEDVAEYMVEKAFQGLLPSKRKEASILDPACGTGVFLRVAFRYLVAKCGVTPEEALHLLFGCDICLQSVETVPFVLLDTYCQATEELPDSLFLKWKIIRRNIAMVDSCTLVLKDASIQSVAEELKTHSIAREHDVVYGATSITHEKRDPDSDNILSTSLVQLFPQLSNGADIVIGNPPYSHLGHRSDAKILRHRYACLSKLSSLDHAETCLLFVEMMWQLTKPDSSSAALVVPMSIGYNSNRQFCLCRNAMKNQSGVWDIAFFDREPHALFGEDVKTRNSILFFSRSLKRQNGSKHATFNVTGLKRWTSRQRAELFPNIQFTKGGDLQINRCIPRLGSEIEIKAFNLLSQRLKRLSDNKVGFTSRNLEEIASESLPEHVFVSGTAYNFINVFRSLDRIDLASSETLSSSPAHEISFSSPDLARVGMAILSSRLTYWLWQVTGDSFHVTRRFLQNIPFDIDELPGITAKQLGKLGDRIWTQCNERRTRNVNGGKTTFAFRPVLDAEELTEIDRILVDILGLPVGFDARLKSFVNQLVVMDDENRIHLLK